MKRIPIWIQLILLVVTAFAVAWCCVEVGQHSATQCAIDYPHEGQCGLEAMSGLAFGFVGGIAILVGGTAYIVIAAFKRRRANKQHRLRRSARVFLFDESGDLLLIRFAAQRSDGLFVFWVTPGGEVEPNESDLAAAQRELFEELGIRPPLTGPVHEEHGGTYEHLGEVVRNYDVFFAALCERSVPRLNGVTADEIALMQEARWWSLAELTTTSERIFPPGIFDLATEAWTSLRSHN
jgi:8-oxo-dGTP pyrophosphatase MutT (NUDIX family)